MKNPTEKGANAGLKLSSLVAGMIAGADSVDDMALLRHGAMNKVSQSTQYCGMQGLLLPGDGWG
ncbi:hypothetical protein GCM10023166_19700 [Paeniglutamicibacter cryotolerans]|uniref:Uncharacterized protein n=1 Tax=Paeniglutamicibacter cryotolerans TaxID=670079 RepID=A0A839QN97_9MICC|nr:hypothetical protein [Paeniglutamicibacter cryotolerans]